MALRLGKLRGGNDNYLNLEVTGVIQGLVFGFVESVPSLLNQDCVDKCKAVRLLGGGNRLSELDDRSQTVRTTG